MKCLLFCHYAQKIVVTHSNRKGVQTFHHLTFIHPTVNHGHLITGHLITLKFNHRDTLSRSQVSQVKSHNVKTSKIITWTFKCICVVELLRIYSMNKHLFLMFLHYDFFFEILESVIKCLCD